jgi:carboxylate-amine ligase
MGTATNIIFKPSAPLTLGVEIEFQLVDRDTLNLTPAATEILAAVPALFQKRIKPEFIKSMIEVNTDICETVWDVEKNLVNLYSATEILARKAGCCLYAASLHPFAISSEQQLTEDRRYERILADLQLVGRRFITQGLHVHVGMVDGETAIKVCDGLRIFLPILLALSASSPYYEGQDTGLCSYRAKLFEALPLAGMPDYFKDWQGFLTVIDMLLQAEIIQEVRDVWWDVRPHPDFGTVEIRICDLPSRFDEILALVALIQALVATLAADYAIPPPNMQILRSNKWQAARYGLNGRFVDPFGLKKGTLAEAAKHLLAFTAPAVQKLGTTTFLQPMSHILKHGTSADQQRRIFTRTKDLKAVVEEMRKGFFG